jgi:type I restriction enzyme S subunit
MRSSFIREPIRQLLETIVDNRGMTVPAADGGIPLIATNCIKETSLYPTFENIRYVSEETHRTWFRAHLQPEDILFVNKGTPGRVCMVPDPVSFCAAQDMIGLRADRSKVYPRYLFAFLRSDWVKEKIRNYHVGLAIPHFKKQDLDAITVPKRSDDEQKAIGDLYFLLSEKIELNNRINAELEGMAKLLYDYWFVQFDFPMTTAQAAALGKPHLTGHPYRASGGKMIYNETLKRDIPEGWTDGSLEKLGKIIGGSTPSTEVPEYFSTEGTPWITPKDLSDNIGNRFIQRGDMGVSEKGIKAASLKLLPTGTVLMSSRAPIGYLAIALNPVTTNQGFKSFVPEGEFTTDYIYFTLKHFMKLIQANASGSTFKEISGGTLKAVKIHLPPAELVKKFTEFSSSLSSQKSVLERQNQELTQLRDWLLPMLMNGQVTVGTNER